MIPVILFLFSSLSFACRPSADFVAPTLEKIQKDSDLIFIGTVESSSEEGLERNLVVKMEKVLKGKSGPKVSVKVGASSCDRLGYDALVGTRCLFYTKDGRSYSGLFGNYASKCPYKE